MFDVKLWTIDHSHSSFVKAVIYIHITLLECTSVQESITNIHT